MHMLRQSPLAMKPPTPPGSAPTPPPDAKNTSTWKREGYRPKPGEEPAFSQPITHAGRTNIENFWRPDQVMPNHQFRAVATATPEDIARAVYAMSRAEDRMLATADPDPASLERVRALRAIGIAWLAMKGFVDQTWPTPHQLYWEGGGYRFRAQSTQHRHQMPPLPDRRPTTAKDLQMGAAIALLTSINET